MNYYAGLDVSVKETAVCIVDETSKIRRELKVASLPPAVAIHKHKTPNRCVTSTANIPGRPQKGSA